MNTIIAGRAGQQNIANQVVDELVHAGFPESKITSFYLNPPGMHDLYRVGGDETVSPGAERSPIGIAKGGLGGAVVGAAIGAVTIPVLGIVGPIAGALVGAHLGDLAGPLGAMKDDGEHPPPIRHAGMMVAVEVDGSEQERQAISLLRSLNIADIERTQGTITDGDWIDFDPLQEPAFVDTQMPSPAAAGTASVQRPGL